MLSEFNALDLPSVSLLEERNLLPSCPCVYFVLSHNHEILYIGKSVNLKQRWSGHHLFQQFAEMGNTRLAWLQVSDESLLAPIEFALIKHFAPTFNKKVGLVKLKNCTIQLDEEVFEEIELYCLKLKIRLGKQNAPYKGVVIEEAIARLLQTANEDELIAALLERQKRRV